MSKKKIDINYSGSSMILKTKSFPMRNCKEFYSKRIIVKFQKGSLKKAKSLYKTNIDLQCFCPYDCCGHLFSSHYNLCQKTKNKYEFTVFYARNY